MPIQNGSREIPWWFFNSVSATSRLHHVITVWGKNLKKNDHILYAYN